MDDIEAMKELIEQVRLKLHNTATNKCFTDPEVVEVSQELDSLLNKYNQLLTKKCKVEP